jgi:hypothetical protein
VVDYQKKNWDVFVGLPNSMNDARILHLFSLYGKAMNGTMFHLNRDEKGTKPYLIADKGYP